MFIIPLFISKNILSLACTRILAEFVGIVGGTKKVYDPLFRMESARMKSKFLSPKNEIRILTDWQFTPLGLSVLATSHVIVCSEPTSQVVESVCEVTLKGPAVPSTKNFRFL